MGDHPAIQQGAPDGSTTAGLPGLRSGHPRLSVRLRIGFRYSAMLQSPRARFPGSPQAGSPMLYSLAARPPGPSAVAFSPDGHHASTWSGLPKSAGSRHAPPRGLPPAACGAVAPRFAAATRRRRARTHAPTTQRHGSSRSGSLRRSSVNIRRQSRVRIKARPGPPTCYGSK